MKNISFTYPGSNELVLENISFEIYPGKKIGVVGTSGVGKSTILNLLLRHWELSGGEYTINRKNIRNYLSDDIRKNIAVITQKVFLFNTTVADNIKIGNPDATDDQIVEVAKISGCHAFIEDLPFGYNTIVGEQGAFISGGEMQRIGLARALLKDASLYLFDEPFAHLDVISQNSIWQSLLPYLEKRGMLFVTHQKFGLSKMDEIIVIGGGKVVERGNYSQLIEAGGVFSQMWQLQEDMLFES